MQYKGLVLADTLYPNSVLRESADLDFLIQKEDAWKAKSLLKELNYECDVSNLTEKEKEIYLSFERDLGFYHKESGVVVDLQWEVNRRTTLAKFNYDDLWDKSFAISLQGSKILVPSHEYLLVILCIHGTKHGWQRLKWLYDVHRLILLYKDIDWDEVWTITEAIRCKRMIYIALFLLQDLFGDELHKEVVKNVASDRSVKTISQTLKACMFKIGSKEAPGIRFQTKLLQIKSREKLIDKIRSMLGMGLFPNRDDYFAILPRSLKFLYSVYRPLRLLKDAFCSWAARP